ncbi:MAG: tRNA (N(6)-L-threonylcarbamoyladenosine(37)-C(2))-methylthiotransferase MtaB [Leptospira sp.]|nr:tRNA (N(6)-L-threonylcarbamoyladenosine(37)-C(2))-methylthiotransferase MtaB [Leptospira sp.]NCS93228.1 tRNA (N(6)-L-threonylcarbamoyladenosine(37)-C(2))-methylthiotransferase MtaB [Leptospira sp.]
MISSTQEVLSPSVAVHTLGCRLNFFETDGILSVLKQNGYRVANSKEQATDIIINTCTVTNRADVKNRNIIRSAIKKNPGSKIWVTGCYAQTDREVLENIPGVHGVFGNTEKSSLAFKILGESPSQKLDRFSYSDVLPENHTRAYLKVQDGCNRKCSYCKIPQARGAGVSRSFNDVIDQVKFLQDEGIGEIILTGVNLGWYRNENGEKAFLHLLENILSNLDYSRLRLSSIEPPDVGNDLAELMTHPRFCKFLHIPLQSGSAKILQAMRRTYNPKTFRMRVEMVKAKIPGIFLGTDIILGFPGEEELEFQESITLIQDLGFHKIHAFPYSVRKNTEAEKLKDTVPGQIKKERVLKCMDLSSKLLFDYIESQKGKVLEAIVENDGNLITDNFIKGKLTDSNLISHLKTGQFLDVVVEKAISTVSDTISKRNESIAEFSLFNS